MSSTGPSTSSVYDNSMMDYYAVLNKENNDGNNMILDKVIKEEEPDDDNYTVLGQAHKILLKKPHLGPQYALVAVDSGSPVEEIMDYWKDWISKEDDPKSSENVVEEKTESKESVKNETTRGKKVVEKKEKKRGRPASNNTLKNKKEQSKIEKIGDKKIKKRERPTSKTEKSLGKDSKKSLKKKDVKKPAVNGNVIGEKKKHRGQSTSKKSVEQAETPSPAPQKIAEKKKRGRPSKKLSEQEAKEMVKKVKKVYHCPECSEVVKSGSRQCSDCRHWFHFKCVDISKRNYKDYVDFTCKKCTA